MREFALGVGRLSVSSLFVLSAVGCGASAPTGGAGGAAAADGGGPVTALGTIAGPGFSADNGGTLHFVPTEIDAIRSPATCGVTNPPFQDQDVYLIRADGSQATYPMTELSVTLDRAVVVGQPYSLDLLPHVVGVQDGARSAVDPVLQFSFDRGTDDAEIDPSAFVQVTVTPLAFPKADGEPLTVRLLLVFSDQKRLDITFSAPLSTVAAGCPRP